MYRFVIFACLTCSIFWNPAHAGDEKDDHKPNIDNLLRQCIASFVEPLELRIQTLETDVIKPLVQIVESLESEIAELRKENARNTGVVTPRTDLEPLDFEALQKIELKKFSFPKRIRSRIEELQLNTVADLALLTTAEFRDQDQVGKDMLHNVSVFLNQFGRDFSDLEQPQIEEAPSEHTLSTSTSSLFAQNRALEYRRNENVSLRDFLHMRERDITQHKWRSIKNVDEEILAIRHVFITYGRVLLP